MMANCRYNNILDTIEMIIGSTQSIHIQSTRVTRTHLNVIDAKTSPKGKSYDIKEDDNPAIDEDFDDIVDDIDDLAEDIIDQDNQREEPLKIEPMEHDDNVDDIKSSKELNDNCLNLSSETNEPNEARESTKPSKPNKGMESNEANEPIDTDNNSSTNKVFVFASIICVAVIAGYIYRKGIVKRLSK